MLALVGATAQTWSPSMSSIVHAPVAGFQASSPCCMLMDDDNPNGDRHTFNDQSILRMARRLNGMLNLPDAEETRDPEPHALMSNTQVTPFIDKHFPGRKELAKQREAALAKLAELREAMMPSRESMQALVEKLEQIPQAEASVVAHDHGYTIACVAPGVDVETIALSVDGESSNLVIVGQTVVDVEDGPNMLVSWQLPVELPPDADLREGTELAMEHEGDTLSIEVPRRGSPSED